MKAMNRTNIINPVPARLDAVEVAKDTGLLPKLLYSIEETAYILSVSTKTVRRFLQRGLLKSSYAIRTKLITRESILTFIKTTT
jgi:hypothetical protein